MPTGDPVIRRGDTHPRRRTAQATLSPSCAGVLLQKYIQRHWSYISTSFEEPSTSSDVKTQIRPIVFHGLSDSNRKIRAASAFALSTIAKYDWPEEYPSLLSDLVGLLSGSTDSVHGAMRVIAEFVKNDLSEDQLIPVVENLVPALLRVLGDTEAHSPATRASTINVFRQVIRMLETVRDEHPQAVRQALETLCPPWFHAFQQLLANDPVAEITQSWEYLGIRIEIFRTFNLFLNAFPKFITSEISNYLRLSIYNLSALLDVFTAYYVTNGESAVDPPAPAADVGFVSPSNGIDDLACGVFDFLTPAVRNAKSAPILAEGSKGSQRGTETMRQVIELVLDYTQVTRANEEEWLEDANAFIMDEDEDTEQYGLRTTGLDLIGSVIDKWPEATAGILQDVMMRRVHSALESRHGDVDWWKRLEAVLSLFGGIADDVRNVLEDDAAARRPASIDLGNLFDNVLPGLLNSSDTPFLQGRAFVFASQYASSLSSQLAGQYLAAAVSALGADHVSIPVKISAVKTIRNFCRFVDSAVIQPQSSMVLSLLLPLLAHADGETLYLLLETIRAIAGLDKELLNAQTVPQVAQGVYEIWLKYSQDPVLTAIVEELFEALSTTSPQICRSLVLHVAPQLAAVISTPTTEETVHLPAEAIQLANSLVRTRGEDIEAEYVATITSAILALLQTTDDMDVIQHGCIHLTYLVRKDCAKLVQWRDAAGNNGIASIFGLLGRLLAPTFSESGGIFVGDLIMHLFRKAGESMGPVLPDLLRAIAQRLSTAKMSTFVVSLVLPFAYLFGTEYTTSTIDLLSSFTVPTPDGADKSGLEIVLNAWAENCDTLAGSWDLRVSSMGLSRLFALPDDRLRRVVVKGDMIITEKQRTSEMIMALMKSKADVLAIMTRSRTKSTPIEYTSIPFPLKALKLLLKDVQHVERKQAENTGGRLDVDDDDGDEEWDDDDPLGDADPVDEFGYLSSWLDAGAKNDHAQDDDEDLRADPLAQVDMGAHLTAILRELYAINSNGIHEMIDGLSEEEKGVLRQTLTM